MLENCSSDAFPFAAFEAETEEEVIKFLGGSKDACGVITIPVKNLENLAHKGLVFRRLERPGCWSADMWGPSSFVSEEQLSFIEFPLILVPKTRHNSTQSQD